MNHPMNRNHYKALLIFILISTTLSLFFTNCSDPSQQFQANSEGGSSTSTTDIQTSNNPVVGNEFSGKVTGVIDSVSISGQVWGYAFDPVNKSKTLKVLFYLDGPVGVGTLIGEALANIQSLGINAGHYYKFDLPPAYADGKNHKIYAYGQSATPSLALTPGEMSYASFTPKAEPVYNSFLNSYVSNCSRCHSWNFNSLYYGALVSPTPLQGGTATNNKLINKLLNGHNGNSCNGNLTTSPCSNIQAWWNAEFK